MVCKETLSCPEHGYLFPDEVISDGENRRCRKCNMPVTVGRVEKMSKSKKNVIDPHVLLEKYGADTTRLFCLFAAPPERDLEWSEQGVEGGYRFINRVWRFAYAIMDEIQDVKAFNGSPDELEGEFKTIYKKTHQTIQKVTDDIEERLHFNTAISAIMELVNALYGMESFQNPQETEKTEKETKVLRFAMETICLLLSPVVPHVAEALWYALGHRQSILLTPWPGYKEDALTKEELVIVVQVNGKLRSRLHVSVDTDEKDIKKQALEDEKVLKFIGEKPVKKIIVVKNKLINIAT
jgi:leucyl-tRNA synthetase